VLSSETWSEVGDNQCQHLMEFLTNSAGLILVMDLETWTMARIWTVIWMVKVHSSQTGLKFSKPSERTREKERTNGLVI